MSDTPPEEEDTAPIDADLNVSHRFGWDSPARIQTTAEVYSGSDE